MGVLLVGRLGFLQKGIQGISQLLCGSIPFFSLTSTVHYGLTNCLKLFQLLYILAFFYILAISVKPVLGAFKLFYELGANALLNEIAEGSVNFISHVVDVALNVILSLQSLMENAILKSHLSFFLKEIIDLLLGESRSVGFNRKVLLRLSLHQLFFIFHFFFLLFLCFVLLLLSLNIHLFSFSFLLITLFLLLLLLLFLFLLLLLFLLLRNLLQYFDFLDRLGMINGHYTIDIHAHAYLDL
mmetsp:Transcript_23977/g.60720  ORF Transcript_23977/g.60720 Transcript_23977/m.60720 type:complete len:241 (-) Transcript_23977:571-1293(-)